jgi:hypothetical protein
VSHEIIIEMYVGIGVKLLENRDVKSLLVIFLGFKPPCFGSPYLRRPLMKMGNLKAQWSPTLHLGTPKPLGLQDYLLSF